MVKNKILYLGLILLLIATLFPSSLMLTSCTSKATTSTSTTSITTSTTSPITNSNTPQYGGTLTVLNYWYGSDPQGFDAGLSPAVWTTVIWDNPFLDWLSVGGIDQYGPRGNNAFTFQTSQYIPGQYLGGGVAESWSVTLDPVTITFNIRPGIMWAGNTTLGMPSRELTADDVVWSEKRAQAAPVVKGDYDFITDIVAKDKYTVVMDCSSFNADWLFLLAYGNMPGLITCPESGNSTVGGGGEDWRNQVSDGPFIISNYISGTSVTYTRNSNYWGSTTINGKQYKLPFIDSLVYPIMPDEATALAALRTGKVDWWPTVPSSYGTSLKQTSSSLAQSPWTTGEVYVVWVNRLDNQYLKNTTVRQALETATDFQTITNIEFPGGTLLGYPIAPGNPAYTSLQDLPSSIKSQFTYNPTLAQQMLTTAGYPKGFSLTLQVDSKDSTESDVAQLIENEWAKVGVQVTIDSLPTTALEANRMSRSYDLLMHQFNVNDPVNVLLSFNGAVGNTSALYSSTEPFAAMYQTIINDTDLTKQTTDIKQMALAVLADGGYIPLADPVELNCYWPWLKNYYGETDAGYSNLMPMISELWIDPNLKN